MTQITKRCPILFTVLILWLFTAQISLAESGHPSIHHQAFFHLLYPDKDAFRLGYEFRPENKEEDGPGEFDLQRFSSSLQLLLALNKDTFIRTGLRYTQGRYDFKTQRFARINTDSEVFHRASLELGWGTFLSDRLLVSASFYPGLYSNLESSPEEEDFQYFAETFVSYQLNPGAQLILGVERNEVFDGESLIPLLGIRLLSQDGSLHLSLTFPREASLHYKYSPQLQLFTGLWIDGAKYRLKLDSIPTAFNAQVHERRVGLGFRYWLGEYLSMGLEGGLNFHQEFEFKINNAGQFTGDLDPTAYLQTTLGLNL